MGRRRSIVRLGTIRNIRGKQMRRLRNRSRRDLYQARLLLPLPTEAAPGTAEKLEILRQRVERGEALHHPLDARQAAYRACRARHA